MWTHGFRYCFTPLPGVLFTFPSRYLSAIGLSVVFSLAGWCRQIHTGFLRSRATQDAAAAGLGFGYGTLTPCGAPSQGASPTNSSPVSRSFYPARASTRTVWAPPRSLTTTWGITVVFSSSAYLDVSVRRVRLPCGITLSRLGCPIRTSADRRPFAPPRGFSQLITSFVASESQGIPHTPLVTSCSCSYSFVFSLLYSCFVLSIMS